MPKFKRRKFGEGVEYISCRLCRRSFRAINASHLVRKHGFDWDHPVDQYKQRFRLRVAVTTESSELRRQLRFTWLEGHGRRLAAEEVVRILRAERAAGRTLVPTAVMRRFHVLHRSAVRRYGSWERAMKAAGLKPDLPRRARVWSREKVLAAIRSLPDMLALNKVRRIQPRLCEAALRYFGSWPGAVRAAGRHYPPPGGPWKWTRDRVIAELRARAKRGQSVKRSHVSNDLPGLVESACMLFRCWREAVRTAGLEGRLPVLRRHWTKEELIQLLHQVRSERETVTYAALSKVCRPGFHSPIKAVEMHFGTLSRARIAVGLPAREWRSRIWSRERVLEEIRTRVSNRRPVRTGAVQEEAGGLMVAAKRYFGSWRKAAGVAGAGHLLGTPFRRWTKEQILERIRSAARDGRSLAGRDFRKADPAFYRTVLRRLGSWPDAVRAAGLASRLPVPPRHWTRKELIDLLQSYWRRTGRLSSEVIKAHKRPGFFGPMFSVTKVFGSFPAAKRAAGLDLVPSYPVRKWTPKAVVAGLRDRARRGLPMNYSALERQCYPLLRAAYARFGTISEAFSAAGISRSKATKNAKA